MAPNEDEVTAAHREPTSAIVLERFARLGRWAIDKSLLYSTPTFLFSPTIFSKSGYGIRKAIDKNMEIAHIFFCRSNSIVDSQLVGLQRPSKDSVAARNIRLRKRLVSHFAFILSDTAKF